MIAASYLAAPPLVAAAVVLNFYIHSGSPLVAAMRTIVVALLLGAIVALILWPRSSEEPLLREPVIDP